MGSVELTDDSRSAFHEQDLARAEAQGRRWACTVSEEAAA